MPDSPDPATRRSVFISYSHEQTTIARRVQAALTAQGIHAWLDQAELLPGNPDWQAALRNAIKHSHALILLASPQSQASRYVRDELDLADAYQRPIYPLWILGEVWIESIPLGRGSTQFIDARGASEQAGVEKLIASLHQLLGMLAQPPQRSTSEVTSHENINIVVPMEADFSKQFAALVEITKAEERGKSERQEAAIPVGMLLATLNGHAKEVYAVAWSPDGSRLASASRDRTVRLWDATGGTLPAILSGHTGGVYAVAWLSDGSRLASASYDQTIRLWDATNRKPLATLSGHTSHVWEVAWSPDGRRLASASIENIVLLWDVASGRMIATLSGHTESVSSVAWSPDGKRLASSSDDNTIRIWKV